VQVTDEGVPVQELIGAIKQAIKQASVSTTDTGRDVRVASVRIVLHTVATRSLGGGADFRVPFIGMPISIGGKVSTQDTHRIEIGLVPPDLTGQPELREADLGSVLVDAIETIRAAVASAAVGDDPFVLTDSQVDISFAVTAAGTISLGVDGSLAHELTHSLCLTLVPAASAAG
jgi:Trypsin-co-occurring domain 2